MTDTHALLWLLSDPSKLSAAASSAFRLVEAGLAHLWLPAIALAELVHLSRRRGLALTLEAILRPDRLGSVVHVGAIDLPVLREFDHLEAPSEIHDRLIVATARVLGAPLITADSEIRSANVIDVIW